MAYSEGLADRVRVALVDVPNVIEKEMFRGLCFMVDDKMCINVGPDWIMCRIDPERHDELLEEMPCRTMMMKGKEYRGYIMVNEEDLGRNKDLGFWVGLCLEFNGRAKRAVRRGDRKGAGRQSAGGTARKGADRPSKRGAMDATGGKKKTAAGRVGAGSAGKRASAVRGEAPTAVKGKDAIKKVGKTAVHTDVAKKTGVRTSAVKGVGKTAAGKHGNKPSASKGTEKMAAKAGKTTKKDGKKA